MEYNYAERYPRIQRIYITLCSLWDSSSKVSLPSGGLRVML